MFSSKKNQINKTIRITKVKQQGVQLKIDECRYLNLKIGNAQHKGAREYQEDSFGYSNIIDSDFISEKGFIAVLADGMGGLNNGKAISEHVITSFIKMFDSIDYNNPFNAQLEHMTEKINNEVCKNFSLNGKSDAGSTVVVVFTYKTKMHWICVGDSRLYLIRNGFLYQVNEDHDYYNQLLFDNINGDLTIKEIKSDLQKDSLTSYIGNEKLPLIDCNIKGFSINKNDIFILCSDGIYNGIKDSEIIEMVKQNEPQRASEKIAQTVLNKNIIGQDNLTLIILKFE